MHTRSLLLVGCLWISACDGSSEAVQNARSSLRSGQLERAERALAQVEGAEADEVRRAIAKARAEREAVATAIERLLAEYPAVNANQLRERLRALRDKTVDVEAREKVVQALSDLADTLAQRTNQSVKPNDAREAADRATVAELQRRIKSMRAELDDALQSRRWRRAHDLIVLLEHEPRDEVGDLTAARRDLEVNASAESALIAAEARELERTSGALVARDWLRTESERFSPAAAAANLAPLLRELAPRADEVARLEFETQMAELEARDALEALARSVSTPEDGARAVPETLTVDQLIELARERSAADDLEFARQCWLNASRKVFPGNQRDDFIGEAQDLRARSTLRDELIASFRSNPSSFRGLGVDAVDASGWTENKERKAWSSASHADFARLAGSLELSQMARRGLLCEVLRSGDDKQRERALADLARGVARGEFALSDASNMVARARGELGTSRRWELSETTWVTQSEAAAARVSSEDSTLVKTFAKAKPDQRGAAFAELLANGSEEAVRGALTARTKSAVETLAKHRTTGQLEALATARREFDQARKDALDLIFDEAVYFYPYNPPTPPKTAGDYAKAQQRVDELVSAVREAAERGKAVKLGKDFREACEEVEWCRATHADLKMPFELPEAVPAYLFAQPTDLEEITLATFAWTSEEAARLAYDRKVVDFNERRWAALDREKEIDPALFPNVAEREQVRITNRYRMLMGRRAVAWNPRIQIAAQGHSEYMANTGDFGHFEKGDPTRYGPSDRAKLAGYPRGASENCAMVGGDPQAAHDGWLHSSGHHRNILTASHLEMASGNASNYWTQNFGSDTGFQKELSQ